MYFLIETVIRRYFIMPEICHSQPEYTCSTTRCSNFQKHILRSKYLIFSITCASYFLVCYIWNHLSIYNFSPLNTKLNEHFETIKEMDTYKYQNNRRLSDNLKYILIWTQAIYAPVSYLGSGQCNFIFNNCSKTNCYVTTNRSFFGGDITKFDAVVFNGFHIKYFKRHDIPKARSSHQKYIFMTMESSDNDPICRKIYDVFFNWTSTYKLSSDIPYPYILIRNKIGNIVGPKVNMKWSKEMQELDLDSIHSVLYKTKAAAWFVSNCWARSGRMDYVRKLQKALNIYGLNVDVYGQCGVLKCVDHTRCVAKLSREYFFYMSMENSFAEDYVTEKLLTAVQNYVIPIVYGGANYSRFLPPGSYLDGVANSPEELANLMKSIIESPKLYSQFFWWRQQYTYHDPSRVENVCAFCAAMNNKTMVETHSVYASFRGWWNPHYLEECKRKAGGYAELTANIQ